MLDKKNLHPSGWRQLTQLIIGGMFPSLVYTTEQEKKAMHPISKVSEKQYRGMAYFHVQSVLPDSYGYGMVDSPVGLIGWIGKNFTITSSGSVLTFHDGKSYKFLKRSTFKK